MRNQSVPCWKLPVGDWQWRGKRIAIMLPTGMIVIEVSQEQVPQDSSVWYWDGNIDKPTLSPSIHVNQGQFDEWHGYLREGKVVNLQNIEITAEEEQKVMQDVNKIIHEVDIQD